MDLNTHKRVSQRLSVLDPNPYCVIMLRQTDDIIHTFIDLAAASYWHFFHLFSKRLKNHVPCSFPPFDY